MPTRFCSLEYILCLSLSMGQPQQDSPIDIAFDRTTQHHRFLRTTHNRAKLHFDQSDDELIKLQSPSPENFTPSPQAKTFFQEQHTLQHHFFKATHDDDTQLMQHLLEWGADPNEPINHLRPLQIAISHGNLHAVKHLIYHNVKINNEDLVRAKYWTWFLDPYRINKENDLYHPAVESKYFKPDIEDRHLRIDPVHAFGNAITILQLVQEKFDNDKKK